MPLTKEKKEQVVDEVKDLLSSSKMTVVATYSGTPVKALQQLRREAAKSNTKVKVVKNRLVIQALKSVESLKEVNTSQLNGMLVYAFNSVDEITAAQNLASFAKTNPSMHFVGAISSDGKWVSAEEITTLASLPGKNELIGLVVTILYSPIRSVIGAAQGGLPNLINALANR